MSFRSDWFLESFRFLWFDSISQVDSISRVDSITWVNSISRLNFTLRFDHSLFLFSYSSNRSFLEYIVFVSCMSYFYSFLDLTDFTIHIFRLNVSSILPVNFLINFSCFLRRFFDLIHLTELIIALRDTIQVVEISDSESRKRDSVWPRGQIRNDFCRWSTCTWPAWVQWYARFDYFSCVRCLRFCA